MAVNVKTVTVNQGGFNYYTGIGLFEVIFINPNRTQLSQLFPNSTATEEPVYLSKDKDGIDVFRLDIYFKLINNPKIENFIHKVTFFLRNENVLNTTKDKIKVINKYGMTMYIPIEDYKNNTLPENLLWFPTPYTKAYPGQEELINFLKAYFATPSLNKVVNGVMTPIAKPEEAEMSIDDMPALLTGNLKELQPVLDTKNPIKLLVGIRKTEDNKVYQDTFMQGFIKANTRDYKYLQKHIDSAKEVGRYSKTEFILQDLDVYTNVVEKTINDSPIPSYQNDILSAGGQDDSLPF